MKFLGHIILRFGIFFLLEISVSHAYANYVDEQLITDTFHASGDTIHLIAAINNKNISEDLTDDSIETELLDSGNNYLKNDIKEKDLLHFVGSNKFKNDFHGKKVIKKMYGKLAKIFARKKYYPIAMLYYFKTLPNGWQYNLTDTDKNEKPAPDGFYIANNNASNDDVADTDGSSGTGILSSSFQDAYFNNSQSFIASRKGIENNSEPIMGYSISKAFDDGKNSGAYAIIIHVKQPAAGRRKAFTGINNVGHTFVTLVKYNSDSTCVAHSFGFYPQKNSFLSATPLHPASSSVFKDDAVHDWDEAVGKFISEKRFKKLIRLISKFEEKKYDLNSNNCTDFGLYAAGVAGISIGSTMGTWPLGRGNNPANAGQSILEGKFINSDTGNMQGLFICKNVK